MLFIFVLEMFSRTLSSLNLKMCIHNVLFAFVHSCNGNLEWIVKLPKVLKSRLIFVCAECIKFRYHATKCQQHPKNHNDFFFIIENPI